MSRNPSILLALIGSTLITATAYAQTSSSPDSANQTSIAAIKRSSTGSIAQLFLDKGSLFLKRGYVEATPASDGKVNFRECDSETTREIDKIRLSPVNGECPKGEGQNKFGTGTWVAIIDSFNKDGSVTLKSTGKMEWSIPPKEWEKLISAVPATQDIPWNKEGSIVGYFASQERKILFPIAPKKM